MSNLYDITGGLLELQQMLQDGEFDYETIMDTMEGLNLELEEKAEGYAKIIKNLTSDINGLKAEEERLYGMRKSTERRIGALTCNLEASMLALGKEKFKTPLFAFNIQNNPPSLKLDEGITLPADYYIPQEPKLDSKAIKDALKNGQVIEGARLEQSKSLRIR